MDDKSAVHFIVDLSFDLVWWKFQGNIVLWDGATKTRKEIFWTTTSHVNRFMHMEIRLTPIGVLLPSNELTWVIAHITRLNTQFKCMPIRQIRGTCMACSCSSTSCPKVLLHIYVVRRFRGYHLKHSPMPIAGKSDIEEQLTTCTTGKRLTVRREDVHVVWFQEIWMFSTSIRVVIE